MKRDSSRVAGRVVAVWTWHQCGVCGDYGMVTQATHELRYRRDSAEERDYAQFVCEDCLAEMPLDKDDPYQKEDYVRLG